MDIICDIDGTVADCSHRLHWIRSKPKNWKAFFAGAMDDKPILEMIVTINALKNENRIIFCTGRSESNRNVTSDWLATYVGEWTKLCPIYMREDGDYRHDDIVKEELLVKIRKAGYEPTLAFDDRDRVVAMWRRNHIRCFQVADGNF